jgi:predicted helicase
VTALGDLLGRLDPDPYRRGKQFERICKWFLTHDPVRSGELRHVWLWKEWPDRWSDAEAGIDLVAERGLQNVEVIAADARFEDLGWTTVDVESVFMAAHRLHRLPLWLRHLAYLAQPEIIPVAPGTNRGVP